MKFMESLRHDDFPIDNQFSMRLSERINYLHKVRLIDQGEELDYPGTWGSTNCRHNA